jgi:hypothetical protein
LVSSRFRRSKISTELLQRMQTGQHRPEGQRSDDGDACDGPQASGRA